MKNGSLVKVVWLMSIFVPVAVASASGSAEACGTAVYREIDSRSQLVASAEQALSEGRYARAAAKAVDAFPALKIVKPGSVPLADRALRILALASVRADGGVAVNGFKSKTASDRAANLDWSVATLRGLNALRPNNPSYETDLGEALAKVPAAHDEAKKLLGGLADKDLLTSAEGYAALAHLRAKTGDNAGRDEAVNRCEAMTKTPRVCAAALAVGGTTGQT
jgi:hypothetical protein